VDSKTVSSFAVTSTLSSGKSRFNLLSLSGSSFPKMPDADTLAKLDWQTLSAETLAELIDGTLFSASLDATREPLYACLLESKAGHLRMVSSDGYRLSRIDRVGELKLAQPLCIPRDGIVELRKLCSAKVRNVDLAVSGTTLYFRASGQTLTTYSTILSTAQFPPYEQRIPRDSARSVSVEVAALTAAVKRLSLAASEKTTGAALNFAFNKLTLRTDNPDVGTAEEDIDFASEDTFDDFKFGISLRYLGEALERIATPNAVLRFNGQLDPLLMYGTGSDATHGDVFVVMPMRL
jgi:DNA polymerase-3 subunit beta